MVDKPAPISSAAGWQILDVLKADVGERRMHLAESRANPGFHRRRVGRRRDEANFDAGVVQRHLDVVHGLFLMDAMKYRHAVYGVAAIEMDDVIDPSTDGITPSDVPVSLHVRPDHGVANPVANQRHIAWIERREEHRMLV